MFASVITTKHKMVKNGLLYHKHLGQIWRAPQYPESLHRQLIALLQQFEIMFELPEIENKPATAEELLSADNDQEGGGKCYLLPRYHSVRRHWRCTHRYATHYSMTLPLTPRPANDCSSVRQSLA